MVTNNALPHQKCLSSATTLHETAVSHAAAGGEGFRLMRGIGVPKQGGGQLNMGVSILLCPYITTAYALLKVPPPDGQMGQNTNMGKLTV